MFTVSAGHAETVGANQLMGIAEREPAAFAKGSGDIATTGRLADARVRGQNGLTPTF
jgi:hypothetical protein